MVNDDVFIFAVTERGTNTWEVNYYEKKAEAKVYNPIGYCSATVEKQEDGSYKGGISHSSPSMPIGETY